MGMASDKSCDSEVSPTMGIDRRRIHFIGIGGAGMSGIALVLHQRGYSVTGSDIKESKLVNELRNNGIGVSIGHDPALVDQTLPDIVVISSAIQESNPELMRAMELGIPVWPRAKMLSFLSDGQETIAVAGTHGKTTTSSMVATMLDKMGLDPTFLIGGIINEYGTNGRDGSGRHFVAEADESDGSFMYLRPTVAVVTNIDRDHLDHYGTMERLEREFTRFMGLVGEEGHIVAMGDDERLLKLARSTGCDVTSYGFCDGNDYVCHVEGTHELATEISIRPPSGKIVHVTIRQNPGIHNVLNATAAIAVAGILSLDVGRAAEALSEFGGVGRRFSMHGAVGGITVMDDYGHHPTEIANTLAAASELGFDRVVCAFQPHRYTRTLSLMDEFGTAFDAADKLFVMDVFSAGEMAIPGASAALLADTIAEHGDVDVSYEPSRMRLIDDLCDELRPGDLLVMQGAGDIVTMIPLLMETLRKRWQD